MIQTHAPPHITHPFRLGTVLQHVLVEAGLYSGAPQEEKQLLGLMTGADKGQRPTLERITQFYIEKHTDGAVRSPFIHPLFFRKVVAGRA